MNMSLMACNALDYLVAVAMSLEVDAREDGVYLKDGTRWQLISVEARSMGV